MDSSLSYLNMKNLVSKLWGPVNDYFKILKEINFSSIISVMIDEKVNPSRCRKQKVNTKHKYGQTFLYLYIDIYK